jgi:hypothetical protein
MCSRPKAASPTTASSFQMNSSYKGSHGAFPQSSCRTPTVQKQVEIPLENTSYPLQAHEHSRTQGTPKHISSIGARNNDVSTVSVHKQRSCKFCTEALSKEAKLQYSHANIVKGREVIAEHTSSTSAGEKFPRILSTYKHPRCITHSSSNCILVCRKS